MKVKSFNDKLNVEIEKNIRMNIEEEMKVRAGKAEKKEKQPKKKWIRTFAIVVSVLGLVWLAYR